MADDKTKRGGGDRARVAAGEPYEVAYFARKHGITQDETRALIERVGNDRAALDAAAAELPKAAANADDSDKARAKPRRRKSMAKEATQPVAAIVAPVVEPVQKAVKPVRRRVAAQIDKVVKVPTRARRGVSGAVDNVKSATSGRTLPVLGAAAAGIAAGLAFGLGRKIAVQAPSTLAGDWFETVKFEHKLALALFDKLQATIDDEVGKRAVLLTQLKHALGKHAFMEENVLYPALRSWGDTADADKLNHDHGYVKQYLYDLEQLDDSSPDYLPKVAEFRAQIEEHIREEEEAIFPPLHAALGDAANAKVTALANKEGFKLA